MKDIKNLSDDELYNLIDIKTYKTLSEEEIHLMMNIIKDTIKEIDEEKFSSDKIKLG